MPDLIRITGLTAETVIGIFAHEREMLQTLRIDLEVRCDTRAAAASDRIDAAVDYAALSERVLAHVRASRCELIERLAAEIAALCLEDARAESVLVTVHKPGAVPDADDVSVTIERRAAT